MQLPGVAVGIPRPGTWTARPLGVGSATAGGIVDGRAGAARKVHSPERRNHSAAYHKKMATWNSLTPLVIGVIVARRLKLVLITLLVACVVNPKPQAPILPCQFATPLEPTGNRFNLQLLVLFPYLHVRG